MIEHRTGDIFEQPDLNYICHQANLYHTFGSGLAAVIKKKLPEAYEADLGTPYGAAAKLGTWSMKQSTFKDSPIVINIYAQIGLDSQERTTSYDAMDKAMRGLRSGLADIYPHGIMGIPHGIGCGLANGSWPVVHAIIKDVFDATPIRVVIVKLPGKEG